MPRLMTDQFKFDRQHLFANIRKDFLAASGEFVGTTLFLLVGLGGIAAAATSNRASVLAAQNGASSPAAISTAPSIEQLMYIAISMGLSLLFSVWIFYRPTGAAFNPNISFALWLIGALKPARFVLYCIAQFAGAIAAAAILDGLLPGPLTVTPTLGAGTSKAQGVFIEMFGTAALILSVMFVAVEKHRSTFLAPVCIGLTLFAVHLWAVVYTGAGVNTARAFGPAVITGFPTEHWIYWLGPTLGALVAAAIYMFLKAAKYWQLNPGQDEADPSKSLRLFAERGAPREHGPKASGSAADGRLDRSQQAYDDGRPGDGHLRASHAV